MFLHLLQIAPMSAEVEIAPLPLETSPPVKVTDYAATLVVENQTRFVFHVEFLAWYKSETPEKMAEYGASLAWQHRHRVISVLLLLRPEGVPKEIPTEGILRIGDTVTTHPFRTVKMWEMDPTPILKLNDTRLFPWALLMSTSDEEVRRMTEAVGRVADEETVGRFLSLGAIRYDRGQLAEMLRREEDGFRGSGCRRLLYI